MKKVFIILFFTICSIASATKYYVSSTSGSDGSDGLSEGSAWKTISKVNGKTFLPGDIIQFKCGEIWRETLTVPSSGNSGARIVITSYGTGAKPKILGSTQAITWTSQGGNIWKSATSVSNPYGGTQAEIFFTESGGSVSWGVHKSDPGTLSSEYDWSWSSNYLYVYAATDPDSRYTKIEVPQRNDCINLNDKQYITIDGLEFQFALITGVNVEKSYPNIDISGLTIRNCYSSYFGAKNGIGFGFHVCYSDMLIQNNVVHDCGRRSISIENYGSPAFHNIIIEGNELYNAFHTTGVDIGVGSSYNGGSFDNIIIRNNLIYDDPNASKFSIFIFLQCSTRTNPTLTNVYIYNNIFKYPSAAVIQSESVDNLYIYNNTFYGHNTVNTGNTFYVAPDATSTNINIRNNIFYTSLNRDNGGSGLSIYCVGSTSQIHSDYNLYYRTADNLRIIQVGSTTYYRTASSWAAMKAATGWEAHSPAPSDPIFVSASDYHLGIGSTAIGAGMAIPEIKSDYESKVYSNPPDLGCYATHVMPEKPVYVSSAIGSSTPSILEMTYDLALANIVPAASAFEVRVNAVVRTLNTIAISGTKVLLTLATPIVFGDVVTVAYTKPASNPVQTTLGGQALSIIAQPVTNKCLAPIPVIISSVVENSTPSILEMTYDLTLANIIPSVSAFEVRVNTVVRTLNTIAISGTKVLLTLATPVVFGDVVTVAYTKPASNPVQTTFGGQALSIIAQPVTNKCLAPIPVIISSVVENSTPSILEMTYDLTLANIIPAVSAFEVRVNTVVRTLNTIAISGTKVLLTLATPVAFGDVVTVAYTKPASNPVQTTLGGQALSIIAQPVTNKCLAPIPVIISSGVENPTPSILEMTYDMALANIIPAVSAFEVRVNTVVRTLNTIAISGTKVLLTLATPVVFGDVVTVAYTKPASNPVQTTFGGQALSIIAQPVTNKCLAPIISNPSSTKYYVNSTLGNDNSDGHTVGTAWRTISKVNRSTFLPGDSIFLKCGEIWRETLTVPSSGNSGARIVITSYGTGAKPKILGSTQAITWTSQGGNIWKSATSVSNPYGGTQAEIFFTESGGSVSWGVHKSDPGTLSSEYDWSWSSNYLYVYASTDPDSRYTKIEVPQRNDCINLNDKQYITIDGLEFQFALITGVNVEKSYPNIDISGLTIRNCYSSYFGAKNGIGFGFHVCYSDMLIQNNVVHDCGRRSISIENYGSPAFHNIIIEGNELYNAFHTTGVDIGVGSSYNGGSFDNIIIRNNLIYDDPNASKFSIFIFLQCSTRTNPTLTNVYIYNNIFKYPSAAVIQSESVDNLYIYNNTFYGHNTVNTGNTFYVAPDATSTNINIRNNIFYTSLNRDNGGSGLSIYCVGSTSQIHSDYNLYYRTADNLRIIQVGSTTYYRTASSWAAMKAATGWEAHSPAPSDPIFVSASDYHLGIGSTAIGAGMAIPEIKSDYEGKVYSNPPDLGCYATHVMPEKPVYVSSAIGSSTPSILEMTYDLALANIVPAASAFEVRVNAVVRTLNTIAISGTKVLLTLATPIVFGDVVTVAYTKPASNPVQTTLGGQALSIIAQPVTNKCLAPIPVIISSVVENTSSKGLNLSDVDSTAPIAIVMTYNLSLANIVPSDSAFNVQVNSMPMNIKTISITDRKVQLDLTDPIVYGDIVTVSYTKPDSNQLQTSSGSQAESIDLQLVVNNIKNPPITQIKKNETDFKITIYPNPAHQYFNVSFSEPLLRPEIIVVINKSGEKVFEDIIESGIDYMQFPIKLSSGIYFVRFISEGIYVRTQKLIIQ